jgi:hypothetical protein
MEAFNSGKSKICPTAKVFGTAIIEVIWKIA